MSMSSSRSSGMAVRSAETQGRHCVRSVLRTDHFPSTAGRTTRSSARRTPPSAAGIYVLRMTRRAFAFDALLAGVVLAGGQAEAWAGVFATRLQRPHWAEGLGYGAAAGLLLLRRIQPRRCVLLFCGVLAVEFAVFGSPEGLGVLAAPVIAAYTVASREGRS